MARDYLPLAFDRSQHLPAYIVPRRQSDSRALEAQHFLAVSQSNKLLYTTSIIPPYIMNQQQSAHPDESQSRQPATRFETDACLFAVRVPCKPASGGARCASIVRTEMRYRDHIRPQPRMLMRSSGCSGSVVSGGDQAFAVSVSGS